MTEDQAKTKWCPMARQQVTIHSNKDGPVFIASANRLDGDKGTLCIASGCMMWRYSTPTIEPDNGFCGLAASGYTL